MIILRNKVFAQKDLAGLDAEGQRKMLEARKREADKIRKLRNHTDPANPNKIANNYLDTAKNRLSNTRADLLKTNAAPTPPPPAPVSTPKPTPAPVTKPNPTSNGMMAGMKNTWAKTGTMGRVGMVGAGLGVGYMAGKGLGII